MYAIVRAGGHQEKVAVGDEIDVNRLADAPGDTVALPAVLVVDGASVTSQADALSGVKVTAEVVQHHRGDKITVLRYKNKTGYRRRQGHRQDLTRLRVTGIEGV
ncbi:MAG: 50S ribosomal protein L21 [Candidatus Nanopelagicales bacterium]